MPTDDRFYGPSYFAGRGGGGGGSSVADIIMGGGQRQAQLLMDAGRQRAAAFEGIGSDLAGGLQAFGQARADKKVTDATRAAAAPGADINAILSGLPPELQGRAMKGVTDWQDMIGKRAESDARLTKLKQEIAETEKTRQQHDADTLAVGAHHVTQMFDTPAGAVAGANMLYSAAKSNGLADDRMDTFMSGANEAWQAAKGDPRNEAMFLDAFKQQAGPILEGLKMRGSAGVQEKFKPETEKVEITNRDGSKTVKLVEKKPGQTFESSAPIPNSEEEAFIRSKYGAQATPEQRLAGRAAFAAAGRDPNVAAARGDAARDRVTARADARADRSFQFHSAELERTAKPLTDQAERFGRLVETVNQRTPQADALIAPELLTVMAGGSGSGLRMNEAEISRVLGGRTAYEDLKAKLNKFSLDPSKGLSITDAQRGQIRALIGDMNTRIQKKAGALNEARQSLIDADTVEDQRKVMAKLKATLSDTGTGGSGVKKLSRAQAEALPPGTQFIAEGDPTETVRTR